MTTMPKIGDIVLCRKDGIYTYYKVIGTNYERKHVALVEYPRYVNGNKRFEKCFIPSLLDSEFEKYNIKNNFIGHQIRIKHYSYIKRTTNMDLFKLKILTKERMDYAKEL